MLFLFAAFAGLAVGSFLNVVIGRLRSGEKGWRSRSRCPECHAVLRPSELVPLVSFLLLRGHCRSCKKSISWQYPLVEFSTMVLFLAACALRISAIDFTVPLSLLPLLRDWVFISFLTIIFVVDLRDMVVFDSVTLPAAAFALFVNIVLGHDAVNLLLAAVVGAGFFLLQYVVSRGRWIGGGDIRIGAMMGAMLGFPLVILALFAAYIVGAFVALGLMAAGKAKWTGQMAFGTFLSVATVLAMFFGQHAMNWYASLLGL
ncbi:MAG: prepilin peptidase [Patescibacteria group bacterium]|jgi:prepilin signal peptidase PulO-like enzyme (type II secretory pathway)